MLVQWDVVNAIAQSVSAVGTLAAVVVSLTLARKQNRSRLRVRVGVAHIVQQGGPDFGRFLQVSVVNVGFRDTTISTLGWSVGVLKPVHLIQTLSLHELSSTLPRKLAPSESANFLFPWERFLELAGPLGDNISGRWMFVKSRLVWADVFLTTGERARARLEAPIARRIALRQVDQEL
jgi:hypothetical protein